MGLIRSSSKSDTTQLGSALLPRGHLDVDGRLGEGTQELSPPWGGIIYK